MNTNPAHLEFLPNEILIDIFEYLDVQDLFRAIYHLNTRLNTLLQSLNHLSLTLTRSGNHQSIHSQIDLQRAQTIVLSRQADVHLNNFPNLRHLKFLQPTCKQLDLFESAHLPHLEHLFMGYAYFCYHAACNGNEKTRSLRKSFLQCLSKSKILLFIVSRRIIHLVMHHPINTTAYFESEKY